MEIKKINRATDARSMQKAKASEVRRMGIERYT